MATIFKVLGSALSAVGAFWFILLVLAQSSSSGSWAGPISPFNAAMAIGMAIIGLLFSAWASCSGSSRRIEAKMLKTNHP